MTGTFEGRGVVLEWLLQGFGAKLHFWERPRWRFGKDNVTQEISQALPVVYAVADNVNTEDI